MMKVNAKCKWRRGMLLACLVVIVACAPGRGRGCEVSPENLGPREYSRTFFAFCRELDDDRYGLYLLTLQDSNTSVALLYESDERPSSLVLSPDGEMIYLILSTGYGTTAHYTFNVTERVLEPFSGRQGCLEANVVDWSPNGEELLVSAIDLGYPSSKTTSMYTVNVHTGQWRLIREVNMGENVYHPRYSPDGSRIAFQVYERPERPPDGWSLAPSMSLRVICADGTNETQVAPTSLFNRGYNLEVFPERKPAVSAWSPAGDEILFHTWPESEEEGGIYLVNADSSNLRRLVNTGGASLEPDVPNWLVMAWAPDGQQFAYSFSYDDKAWIQRVDSTQRTNVSAELADPTLDVWVEGWTHDGKLVVRVWSHGAEPPTLQILDSESREFKEILILDTACYATSGLVWVP